MAIEDNEEVEDGTLECPFCNASLTDSGGCPHVMYTHTTCDGFLETSDVVEDIRAAYEKKLRAKIFKEERVHEPDLTIDDIEVRDYIDSDELRELINKEINRKFSEVILLETHAVWGSTASCLVAVSESDESRKRSQKRAK